MIKRLFSTLIFLGFLTGLVSAQTFVQTTDLFQRSEENGHSGQLKIEQDPGIDTLISRYIMMNKKVYDDNGHYGMEGFRIQIYSNSNRNAREESSKVNADFISKFPTIKSYTLFAEPGYYKIRVGDFRTKTEATRLFITISKVFRDSYIVPDIINFPDLNNK